jgi:hypothetical protein
MLVNEHSFRRFALIIILSLSTAVLAKEPSYRQRGVLSDMLSVQCGTMQKSGSTVAGALITGAKHSKTQDLLCQEYTIKTDRVIYRIRPRDEKHPVLLPVGEEAEFRLKKDRMILRIPELDDKEREYVVLSMTASSELAQAMAKTQHPPKPHGQELSTDEASRDAPAAAGSTVADSPVSATPSAAPSATQAANAPPAQPAISPTRSEPVTSGFVQLQSTPAGAEIYIDSALAGHTPTTLKLKPGFHSVQVVFAGYKDFATTINVAPGVQQQLTATLTH